MKYFNLIILAIALSFSLAYTSYSQDASDTLNISDDELLSGFDYEPAHSDDDNNSYNVLGIGWNFGAFFNENGNFSDYMQSQFGMGKIEMPIFMNGFAAKIALEPTKHFSFGIQYLTGSKKYEMKTLPDPLKDYSRYLKYNTSYLNLSIDYAFVPLKHFAILGGVGFGLSNLEINYSQIKSDYDYSKEFIPTDNDPNTKMYKMNGSFFSVDPHISLQYVLSSNFMLNVTGSYAFPFSANWEYNNYAKMSGVPNELKPQGWTVSLGLYLGIFDF